MVVANVELAHHQLAHLAVEFVLGPDLARVEGRGEGEGLERRAGLEGVRDGAVARAALGRVLRIVGVVGGHAGHGQDLAGARVDHHRHAGLGVVLGHGLGQNALGFVGQVAVKAEHQIFASHRRRIDGTVDQQIAAQAIVHAHDFHTRALQGLVEAQLHAFQALAVETGVADHGRSQGTVGIDPARLLARAHAGQS